MMTPQKYLESLLSPDVTIYLCVECLDRHNVRAIIYHGVCSRCGYAESRTVHQPLNLHQYRTLDAKVRVLGTCVLPNGHDEAVTFCEYCDDQEPIDPEDVVYVGSRNAPMHGACAYRALAPDAGDLI